MNKRYDITLFIVMTVLAAFFIASTGAFAAQVFRGGMPANQVISIDFNEHENHEGRQYTAFHNSTLGVGGSYQLLINTPPLSADVAEVHLLVLMRGSAESNIVIHEGTVVSDVGSAKTCINHNRQSGRISKTLITLDPTITSLGDVLIEAHFGSGPNVGGAVRDIHEFILLPNTFYLVNAISESATNQLSILLDFEEHEGTAP